eukprot:TRINITY_DN14752_c0_g1_i1.p1 TRINITY_DN14752_c0_g1~~TRINITY_DN14752_c0_g1_i1.p1  ORF type:complete len:754 (+),score=178.45 TRINITY_DN14752_c0_g1_i1:383-2644(+)
MGNGRKKNRKAAGGPGEAGQRLSQMGVNNGVLANGNGVSRSVTKISPPGPSMSGGDSSVLQATGQAANTAPPSSSYSQALKGKLDSLSSGTAGAITSTVANSSRDSKRASAGVSGLGDAVGDGYGTNYVRASNQQFSESSGLNSNSASSSIAGPLRRLSANAPVFTSTLDSTQLSQAYYPGVVWSNAGFLPGPVYGQGVPSSTAAIGQTTIGQNGAGQNSIYLSATNESGLSAAAKESIVKQSKLSALAPEFKSSNASLSVVPQRGFVVSDATSIPALVPGDNAALVSIRGFADASGNPGMASNESFSSAGVQESTDRVQSVSLTERSGGGLHVDADFSESSSTSSMLEGFRDSNSSTSDQSSAGNSGEVGQNGSSSKKWSPVASESGSTTPPMSGEEATNREVLLKSDAPADLCGSRVSDSTVQNEGIALEVEHLQNVLAGEKARAASAIDELENLRQERLRKELELVKMKAERDEALSQKEAMTGALNEEVEKGMAAEGKYRESLKREQEEKEGQQQELRRKVSELESVRAKMGGLQGVGEQKDEQTPGGVGIVAGKEGSDVDGRRMVEDGLVKEVQERLKSAESELVEIRREKHEVVKALEGAMERMRVVEAVSQQEKDGLQRESGGLMRKVQESAKENAQLKSLVEKHQGDLMSAVQKLREVTAERDALLMERKAKEDSLTAQRNQSLRMEAGRMEAVAKAEVLTLENEEMRRQLAARSWSTWLMPSVVGAGVGGVVVAVGVCRKGGIF